MCKTRNFLVCMHYSSGAGISVYCAVGVKTTSFLVLWASADSFETLILIPKPGGLCFMCPVY